jgi:hypothetical protein
VGIRGNILSAVFVTTKTIQQEKYMNKKRTYSKGNSSKKPYQTIFDPTRSHMPTETRLPKTNPFPADFNVFSMKKKKMAGMIIYDKKI